MCMWVLGSLLPATHVPHNRYDTRVTSSVTAAAMAGRELGGARVAAGGSATTSGSRWLRWWSGSTLLIGAGDLSWMDPAMWATG